jgi:hypothetical protein
MIGENLEKLFSEKYIGFWNKLTQGWITTIYENANKNIQRHIEKFIDTNRIESINYFQYFNIKHRDPRFKHLGENIPEFNKNILKFSDLMIEIWKNRQTCISNLERVEKEWNEYKVILMNSKILEHLLTQSLKSDNFNEIKRLDDGFKRSTGSVKMKFIKTIVEKLGSLERTVYYLSKNGNEFYQVPSRNFFRENYENLDLQFNYHVKFEVSEEEEENNFNIKINLYIGEEYLLGMNVLIGFSGGEMSGKLNAKYKFDIPNNFNYLISKKS